MTVLERMVLAVEKVRLRLLRACGILEAAGVPYAVIGGNAVAAWVARVDEAAVRNTQDVDILLARTDLQRARDAMEVAGFVYRQTSGIDMFLDGPDSKARDAVHVLFSNERVRPEYALCTPDAAQSERFDEFAVIALPQLVRMKLTSFGRKDQVHVLDLIGVGLVDRSWLTDLPEELAMRLQELLDDPEG